MFFHASPILELRWLKGSDARAISLLEADAFSLPWSEEQCRRALGTQAFGAWGGLLGGKLLGYVSFYQIGDEVEIINFAVASFARRKGYGMSLLSSLLHEWRKMGIQKIMLEVREGNMPAIGLYEKLGFAKIGARDAYYPDTGEDALIYVKLIRGDDQCKR